MLLFRLFVAMLFEWDHGLALLCFIFCFRGSWCAWMGVPIVLWVCYRGGLALVTVDGSFSGCCVLVIGRWGGCCVIFGTISALQARLG